MRAERGATEILQIAHGRAYTRVCEAKVHARRLVPFRKERETLYSGIRNRSGKGVGDGCRSTWSPYIHRSRSPSARCSRERRGARGPRQRRGGGGEGARERAHARERASEREGRIGGRRGVRERERESE